MPSPYGSQAKAAALRFLKVRPRSVFELRTKLTGKGFDSYEIDAVIAYLVSVDALNDRVFTASWIAYRLARPFGFKRIINELKVKGIAEGIIEEQAALAKNEYVQLDVVLDLAKRRAKSIKVEDPQKKKKRMYDYLLRRGFDHDVIMEALKNDN